MSGSSGSRPMSRTKERYFVDRSFQRFFLPAFLSSLGLALGGMVDCLVVGSKMGAAGLSAISLGIPVYLFYNVLSYGFSIGGSIHYASALADGRVEDGVRLFNNVLRFLLAVYLVTAALGLLFLPQLLALLGADPAFPEVYAIAERYVRAQLICVPVLYCQGPFYYFVHCDDAPKRAAAALVTSNAVDILFNYVFVIRMDMGAEGSVWSTLIGAFFCLGLCGGHILRRRGALRFARAPFRRRDLTESFQTGASSAVQYIYQFITVLAANQLLMAMSGAVGVAVFDVVYNFSLLTAAVADGIGMTLQPMVSTYRAERDANAVRRTMGLAFRYSSLLALLATAGIVLGAGPLCALFGLAGESGQLGSLALRIYALSILPACWDQCMIYYDQSAGRERSAFLAESLRMLLCWLPLALLLTRAGIQAFWLVFPLSELGCLLYVLLGLRARLREDWTQTSERVYTAFTDPDSDLGQQVAEFQEICDGWGCSPQQSYYGTLVLEELCAAILDDARRERRPDVLIKSTVILGPEGLTLHLRDNSYEFDPFAIQEDEAGEVNVLGISIVKKKARSFLYRRSLGFNTLVVKL